MPMNDNPSVTTSSWTHPYFTTLQDIQKGNFVILPGKSEVSVMSLRVTDVRQTTFQIFSYALVRVEALSLNLSISSFKFRYSSVLHMLMLPLICIISSLSLCIQSAGHLSPYSYASARHKKRVHISTHSTVVFNHCTF